MADVLEIEQKFAVDDLPAVQRRVVALGAHFAPAVSQVDRYYAHPARNFARTDEALRIRHVGETNYVTYKGPKIDPQTKTRREIELLLPPGAAGFSQFVELLENLGFQPVADVRKQRQAARLCWRDFQVEVALDDVENVGTFVELETSADPTNLKKATAALAALAEYLGLHGGERRSYLEMLLASDKARS